MANFDNTFGWKKELDDWHNSAEYESLPRRYFTSPPEMPRPDVLQMLDLSLRDTVCRAAIEKIAAWRDANPTGIPTEDKENFPWKSDRIVLQFYQWFAYKKGFERFDGTRAMHSRKLAIEIALGRVDPDDNQAKNNFLDLGHRATGNAY